MAIKLQVRRDTLANWTANSSVVLLEGEIGYVTDTRNMKIGDGTTIWSSLKYQAPYYTGTNSGLATTTLSVDQTNNRVGIGTTTPAVALGVVGSVYVGNQANTGTTGTLGLISTGGANYIQSGQNINASTAPLIVQGIGGGAEWLRVTSSGVGIGTSGAPSSPLHIEGAAPIIRLKDTTSGTAEYASVDADTSTGSISVNANPGNVAAVAANSIVALKVNGTERLRVNDTGAVITGPTSVSGLITADGGLTIPSGDTLTVASGATLTLPTTGTLVLNGAAIQANTIALSKLNNMAAAGVLGATAAGVVTALTSGLSGTAQTALGIGTSAYSNFVPMPTFQTGVGVGQITAGYEYAGTGGSTSITVGAASQTWAYLNVVRGTTGSANGQARVGVVTAATNVTTSQNTESWVFAIRIL